MFRRGRGADPSEVFRGRAVSAFSVPQRIEPSILFFEVDCNLFDAAVTNRVLQLVF